MAHPGHAALSGGGSPGEHGDEGMSPMSTSASTIRVRRVRRAYLDNLKVLMVAAVIVAHVCMAWTAVGVWVVREEPLREPLLSVVTLLVATGGLFGLALFFVIAGSLTPGSVARKGLVGFLADRALRLGVPMVFFVLFLSPIVEYADDDNLGWDRGFWSFVPEIWWPPAPGPTWFLGVLLVFSSVYAVARTLLPARDTSRPSTPLTRRTLASFAVAIAVASYLLRFAAPLGEEVFRLSLAQAPAWLGAFTLGVLGGERGWFDGLTPRTHRSARLMTGLALLGLVLVFVGVTATDSELDVLAGRGTWPSLVVAVLEGVLVVGMSVWLLEVFRRRYDHQGPLAREMGRDAYAAYVFHQVVLVGLVVFSRSWGWPPEVDFLLVAVAGVVLSFLVGGLVVRLPGVRRIL
jgi:glucan biosynthesis protein C